MDVVKWHSDLMTKLAEGQINCQNRCQVSCQGCNTKQCHDQNCGSI